MMRRAEGRGALRDAPALRFLALCLGGWILMRAAILWDPGLSVAPDSARAPWVVPAAESRSSTVAAIGPDLMPAASAFSDHRWLIVPITLDIPTGAASLHDMVARGTATAAAGEADRHQMRIALLAQALLARPQSTTRTPQFVTWAREPGGEKDDAGRGRPLWMQRELAGWSLGAWLYLRGGEQASPDGVVGGGQLGGSQGGVRIAFGFGDHGRLRVYGRASAAFPIGRQSELALGTAYAPIAALPLDIAVEQRIAAGGDGRTALAAMVIGGVSDVALPKGFRLEAYGQAGVVGAARRDGFADGAVAVEYPVVRRRDMSLHLGMAAAGAIQPGAARVDVGPRLTLRLPDVGEGSRIALDWRQRVAGGARPESGLALTLAGDF